VADGDETIEDDDPFGRELEESIRANKALLEGLRYEYGQRMQEAVQGGGEMPSALELAQIKKLEREVHNDEVFAQARKMTRRRSAKTEAEA
jgi:hypothetical protein